MPKEVHRELEAGDDDLAAWCAAVPGLIAEATDAEILLVGKIVAAHPDWVAETRNQADPWVIAHAAVAGVPILTEERLASARCQGPEPETQQCGEGTRSHL